MITLSLFADTRIILKPSVHEKDALCLGDIAVIRSDKEQLRDYLASLAVEGRMVQDGVITKAEVRSIIARSLIDPAKVAIEGRRVELVHSGVLTKERLRSFIAAYVRSHYPDIMIKRIAVDLPRDLRHWRLKITPSSESFSHIYLNIDITADNKKLPTKRASVVVERYVRASVALHDIKRGSLITPQDITTKRVRLTSSASSVAHDVVGSVARTNIKAGRIIKTSMIKPDFPVKRRQSVKIVYQRGPIRIELLGLALQDGSIGQTIKVKNLSSNKVIQCRVIEPGVVQFVY